MSKDEAYGKVDRALHDTHTSVTNLCGCIAELCEHLDENDLYFMDSMLQFVRYGISGSVDYVNNVFLGLDGE